MTKQAIRYSILSAMVIALAMGCATSGGGASDAEQIASLVKKWEVACLAADLDGIMATYSDSFSNDGDYGVADKEELAEYIEGSIDEGNFEDLELYMDDAETEIDATTASVYPIDFINDQGTVTIELMLTKEKGGWAITDMALEGL